MEPPFFEERSHRRTTVERKWNIEHTGALNFFSDNFENILPPPLFEMILQKKKVGLKEFSQAFGITMKEMVEVLQQAPHPFYIDPETLVFTVGSHFMAKSIREKFVLKDNATY